MIKAPSVHGVAQSETGHNSGLLDSEAVDYNYIHASKAHCLRNHVS